MNSSKADVLLAAVLTLAIFDICLVSSTTNELRLEKFICPSNTPSSPIQSLHCIFKYISRTHCKIFVRLNFTRPVNEFWLHGVLYYKFNGLTYQKFPVDLWEDTCKWLHDRQSGKQQAHILDWTIGNQIQYSTLNQSTCPLFGYQNFKNDNFSFDVSNFKPLIPSGRWRLDLEFTESDRSKIIAAGYAYFSVSDYRLEKI